MHKNPSLLNPRTAANLELARATVTRRFAGLPSWVVLIELFIGLGWLRAVAEKVIDTHWWTGRVVESFVATNHDVTLAWYRPFLDLVVLPGAPLIALVVLCFQLLAGISLVTGRRVETGLAAGMFLNLHFLATGAVTPSAFYLLAQGAVALWIAERSRTAETAKQLQGVATAACALAGLNLPFISTLHPAHVIDDPAMMFVFGGALTALACVLATSPITPLHGHIEAIPPTGSDRLRVG